MERISRVFSELVRDLGLEKRMALESIRSRWETVIGESVAQHTLPFSLQKGQLLILVDSPEWLHELRYFQDNITRKLTPYGIQSIRLKLGTIKAGRTPLPRSPRPQRVLSPEDKSFIDALSSGIKNDDVREQIKKAIEKSLAFDGRNSP